MSNSTSESIILAMPEHFMLHEPITKNLIHCGFRVISITADISKYQYQNKKERVVNFFKKIFLNDKNYKKNLLLNQRGVFQRVKSINEKADYALFIRADIYTKEILKTIKSKCHKMVAYQWDGMSRFPIIYDFVKYFDRFFVFDAADFEPLTNILPTTNFYFDYPINSNLSQPIDIFYIGNYIKNRIDQVIKMSFLLEKLGLNLQINIFKNDDKIELKYKNTKINFTKKEFSYQENLEMSKNSKILLDVQNSVHQGLSLRVFEALGFEKKLITNNVNVKYYDFYHPNNILLWTDDTNLNQLKEFIDTPYFKIDDSIKLKYSFTNWVHYLLEKHPYTKIDLPE